VDADDIKAKYEEGVIELIIPKTEQAKPQNIRIEAV
jgi:HSP20 family molecular chaperone IbpA